MLTNNSKINGESGKKSNIIDKMIMKDDADRLKYEFMPSALEIAESPPSPMGKTVIWGIFIIMITAIIWSTIGRVDEVAVARGKVVPNGRIKVVQSLEEGIITGIYVDEGERVKQGQLLLELDTTMKKVDKQALQTSLDIAKMEKLLLEKYLKGQDTDSIQNYIAQQNISNEIKQSLIEFTNSRKESYQTKKQSLELVEKQSREQLDISKQELSKLEKNSLMLNDRQIQMKNIKDKNGVETVNIEKIEQNIKILKEQEAKYKELADQGAVPKQEWEEKKNALDLMEKEYKSQKAKSDIEKENDHLRWKNSADEKELNDQEIESQKIKILQNETKLQEAKSNLENLESQEKQETLNLIVEKQKQIENLKASLEKANKSIDFQTLTSPTNGIVQGISLNTVGGVVSPAQSIMSIVPENTPLIVEAMLPNKDIGFVKQGQKASVKIDTFSFQRYGVLEGVVEKVSPDAFEDENLGPVYKIKIKLDKDTLPVEGKDIKISPGMSVTVEIKTGTRRIIDFFLEPFIKSTDEALKLR